jgi:hypothetical protein
MLGEGIALVRVLAEEDTEIVLLCVGGSVLVM